MTNFNVPNRTSATYAFNGFTTDTCESTSLLGTGVPMSPYVVYAYTPVIYLPNSIALPILGSVVGSGYTWPLPNLTSIQGISVPVLAMDAMRFLTFTVAVGTLTAGGLITITGFDDRNVAVIESLRIQAAPTSFVSNKSYKYIQSIVFSGTPFGALNTIAISISNQIFGSPYFLTDTTVAALDISGNLAVGTIGYGYNFYVMPPSEAPVPTNLSPTVAGIDARGVIGCSSALTPGQSFKLRYYAQGADPFIQAQLNANPIGFTSAGAPIFPAERNQYQAQLMQAAGTVLATVAGAVPIPALPSTPWQNVPVGNSLGLNLYQSSSSYLGGVNELSSFDIYGVQYPGDKKAYNDLGALTSGFPGNTFSPMV